MNKYVVIEFYVIQNISVQKSYELKPKIGLARKPELDDAQVDPGARFSARPKWRLLLTVSRTFQTRIYA